MPTLDFKGKQHIYAHHLTVPYRPLIPDDSKSVTALTPPPYKCSKIDSDTPESNTAAHDAEDNLIIHGDNLHALKSLLPRYAGRIKCIYIDPPYNTGNENWIYNDCVNSPLMREWLQDNKPVDDEDLERHDKWLCMMWPRLHLLRELLADDGAIFISIDDNEQHHLRSIMDEVFGEENLVANIPWESGSPKNDTDISVQHEYLVGYAKMRRQKDRRLKPANYEHWFDQPTFAMMPEPLSNEGFSNPDNDPRGVWKLQTFHAPNIRPNLTYPIVNPETGQEFWPPNGRCWRTTQEQFQRLMNEKRIVFGLRGKSMPQMKVFYENVKPFGVTPQSWWSRSKYGDNSRGTTEYKSIFANEVAFDHPKPSQLIRHLLKVSTGPNDIILDSFAGSGTTAHAVLQLNKEDGGNRKFILVECEDYADNITAERVRRVINGVPNARDASLREGLGGSFTYCTLGKPIQLEAMLTGQTMPSYEDMAAYLLHTATGISAGKDDLVPQNDDGLFYSHNGTNYYLIYKPSLAYLRSDEPILKQPEAKRISASIKRQGRKATVFAPAKYIGQRTLTQMGITFCQLPYGMHQANLD